MSHKLVITGFQAAIIDCSPSIHLSNGNMVTKIWIGTRTKNIKKLNEGVQYEMFVFP